MNIAITIKKNNENSELDSRFGRAEHFYIYNTETKISKIVENLAKNESSGAGINAAKILSDNNVMILITGDVGPKAMDAINGLGIKAYKTDTNITIKEVLELFKHNELEKIEKKHGLFKA